jgi:hypothetical protein
MMSGMPVEILTTLHNSIKQKHKSKRRKTQGISILVEWVEKTVKKKQDNDELVQYNKAITPLSLGAKSPHSSSIHFTHPPMGHG